MYEASRQQYVKLRIPRAAAAALERLRDELERLTGVVPNNTQVVSTVLVRWAEDAQRRASLESDLSQPPPSPAKPRKGQRKGTAT